MSVVKRFCILHHPILLDHLCNVTVPYVRLVWQSHGRFSNCAWQVSRSMHLSPVAMGLHRLASNNVVPSKRC
ncbi:hypothetical protein R69746_08840 [Paraburkholderia aspalathi]|nr:hypothetical protein R69746_08840 [Paraburkholderia aspalathi]